MKSIRSKLIAGLALIIIFFLVQMALVYNGLRDARQDVVGAATKNTLAASQLSELAELAQQIRRYEKEYFVYVSNSERRANYIKEWSGTADKISTKIQTMRKNADKAFSREDVSRMGNWSDAAEFYGSEMNKIFASVDKRQAQLTATAAPAPESAASAPAAKAPAKTVAAAPAVDTAAAEATPAMFSPIEVNTMIGPGKDRFAADLIKGVNDMSAIKTKDTLALSDIANKEFDEVLYAVFSTVLIGILIAALLLWQLPLAVTTPLATLSKSVDEMSKGNLEQKISSGGVAEFEGLTAALERLRLGQQAMVQRMRNR